MRNSALISTDPASVTPVASIGLRPSVTRAGARLVIIAGMLVLGGGVSIASSQTIADDFSSGNDSAWSRIDQPLHFGGVPSVYAIESGRYALSRPFMNIGGIFHTAALRPDGDGTDLEISVDITGWNETENNWMAVLGRITQPAPGVLHGYGLSLFPTSVLGPGLSSLTFSRWNQDGSHELLISGLATSFPAINPSHRYRMVFTLTGSHLEGALYDLTVDPSTPIQTRSFTDTGPGAILQPGSPGLSLSRNGIFPDHSGPAGATYDNFLAINRAAPPECPGDANSDGEVNFADITSVLNNWLEDYTPGTGPGDADRNGVVNFIDITTVLNNWLSMCE